MKFYDLSGQWNCEISGQKSVVILPGTLDENQIGYADCLENQWHLGDISRRAIFQEGDPILTRLTRRYCYEGEAIFTKKIEWKIPQSKRIFLECERARQLQLLVNGEKVECVGEANLSTPYVYEITDQVRGQDTITLISDNRYLNWPYESIIRSSAAAAETQTNWNGILGYIRLRIEKDVFIEDIFVYPRYNILDICIQINAANSWTGSIFVESSALEKSTCIPCDIPKGQSQIWVKNQKQRTDVKLWDEGEGNLYDLTVYGDGLESCCVHFGIRDFAAKNGLFYLNNRRFFLLGETNCAVFPETGYPPMDVKTWTEILRTYQNYGVNCIRFHSYCPPEAAFTAADKLGILMQPELSHWNPKNTFSSNDTCMYYRGEQKQILRMLANHPSFVMLSLGNELRVDEEGHAYMAQLLQEAREIDQTRLYTNSSNFHFGSCGCDKASDFYTAMKYFDNDLRATSGDMQGWLNHSYPDWRINYREVVEAIRKNANQPVFSFEVGQYEILPDFKQLSKFQGITDPVNLKFIQQKVEKKGLMPIWNQMVEATGELSLLCYRAEVEAALRTDNMSGISLLGLQDFPGQGTALVGMMDSHLHSKPYEFASPERFQAFFREILPLVRMPRFTYSSTETLEAEVCMVNYGKNDVSGVPEWSLEGDKILMGGTFAKVNVETGTLAELGKIRIPLKSINEKPVQLVLAVKLSGYRNEYPVWVYPELPVTRPANIFEFHQWNEEIYEILNNGGNVYLSPNVSEENLPKSIATQFSPDFWSICSFINQAGSMGQLIDVKHPIFSLFPTEAYTNLQWWPMAVQRAVLLPEKIQTIIMEIDSCMEIRYMAQLFECHCGNGKLMVSTMGLQNLQKYPEARALQRAIYEYMSSNQFEPKQSLSPEWIKSLFAEQK